jgi:threonine/homoserine/homoserine lactone efflux protein
VSSVKEGLATGAGVALGGIVAAIALGFILSKLTK